MGIPDAIDKFILSEIYASSQEKKEIDHWQLSKKYATSINMKDKRAQENLYRKIKARLDNYCIQGIFIKCNNGNGEAYVMDLNKVNIFKHKTDGGFKYGLWFQM